MPPQPHARAPIRDYPHIGPTPLLLSRAEVDELYDLLGALISCLDELSIPYVLIAGSLLGAVRSQSILFNDDDIDIALIDDDSSDDGSNYRHALEKLPDLLREKSKQRSIEEAASAKRGNGTKLRTPATYMYKRRPWPGCDRVKSSLASRVWIDIFIMQRYESIQDVLKVISVKDNGQAQPQEYIDGIASAIMSGSTSDSIFPLYHFDNRKAIELWPREYFLPNELFPIKKTFSFGPLVKSVAGPAAAVQPLLRFFGDDCFTHYVRTEHTRGKKKKGDTTSWEEGEKLPLSDEQYETVQHSRIQKRVWSKHNRTRLEEYLATSLNQTDVEVLVDSPKERTNWFGATVRTHTADSPDQPNFDKALREVMEPHVAKARLKREQCEQELLGMISVKNGNVPSLTIAPYPTIRSERPFLYDVDSFPLHTILADTIGVDDLSLLHEHPIKDKRMLLFSLLDRDARKRFHQCYDAFVTTFCIPLLHSIAMSQSIFAASAAVSTSITYRYQAFPCIRVIRPGEFSIGPHCDIAYGHSIGNINFHIPLTPAFGTNALYVEGFPGREDWHPLSSKSPGLGYIFDGARCLHFALENTTERTRVSVDFRIAITRCRNGVACGDDEVDDALCSKDILDDRFSSAGPGYYEEAYINMGRRPGPVVVKKNSMTYGGGTLTDPDKRVGFPFT